MAAPMIMIGKFVTFWTLKMLQISSIVHICILVSVGIYGHMTEASEEEPIAPKIAIVGGGIGGASSAHHLRELFGPTTPIDVFEAGKIGGRIQLVEIGGRRYEAGASIIHTSNHLMVNYTRLLGLKVRDREPNTLSIFDGKEMQFLGSSWQAITLTKILWKYGLDMYRLNRLVTDLTTKFVRIYEHQNHGHAFTSVPHLLSSMTPEFSAMTGRTLRDLLAEHAISTEFINDFAMAGLLVNYGQTPEIHAFVGLVAMCGTLPGLWAVHGGNKQVSELLLKHSNANHIPAEVTTIKRKNTDENAKTPYDVTFMYKDPNNNQNEPVTVTQTYDIVIITTPLHEGLSDIMFSNFDPPIKYYPNEYHKTIANFVQGVPNPAFFNHASNFDAILVNNPDLIYNSFARQLPSDWSVSEGTSLPKPVYKIFSKKPVSDQLLREMFLQISDVQRFDWFAYPHYDTNSEFPPFVLGKNLFYVNAIEIAASAMEMSAIGGRNAALLAYNSWNGLQGKVDVDVGKTGGKSEKSEL